MTTRYRPGGAAVLVGSRGLVATGREHVDGLLALIDTDLVVLAVIDTLSQGSLANLPDFACLVAEGEDLRIVLRGGFVARVGDEVLSGSGIATWLERTVAGGATRQVTLEVSGADVQASPGAELPVGSGIVLASSVSWTRTPTAAEPTPAAAPEPAPAPKPEPDPEPDPERTLMGPELEEDLAELRTDTSPHDRSEPTRAAPAVGDHDGRTITAAQLQALRAEAAARPPEVTADLVLPDGVRHPIAPRLLIGRRPQARQMATAEVPTLVAVDDPYVSSTHLDLALVAGELRVTDLSTNGTLITRPGQPPAPLDKSVPTVVEDGTRLALSDELIVTIAIGTGV